MNTERIIDRIGRLREMIHVSMLDQLAKTGHSQLHPAHAGLIYLLYQAKEPLTMQEIASSYHRDASTITALVSKLEQAGYLTRTLNPEDLRSKFVSLTPRGKKTQTDIIRISRKLLTQIYRGFDGDERTELNRLLEKALANF